MFSIEFSFNECGNVLCSSFVINAIVINGKSIISNLAETGMVSNPLSSNRHIDVYWGRS